MWFSLAQVADLPSISGRCKNTSEQHLTAGIKFRAACKVYVSLSRRTTAFEVDGALAAAENHEDALDAEDSVVAVA